MKKKQILKGLIAILVVVIIALFAILAWQKKEIKNIAAVEDVEIRVSKDYEQFEEGDENIEGTDNVKFSAFFLRDLDNDGYAEKLKGSCREVGTQDILYMEIIVQTEGYLKDGKIQIDGKNFYLMTALPKDNEFKGNYIGPNVRNIEFNNLYNGTQKLITGMVRSGNYSYTSNRHAAIGNNINNYSRNDNKIILTGTYVAENGTETEIRKEVDLTVDWHGKVTAAFNTNSTYQNYYDIYNRIDEEAGTITASFNVNTVETRGDLLLEANFVQVEIPQLNGFDPISVELKSGSGDAYYFEDEKTLYIDKYAETDDEGNITTSISRNLYNTIEVVYPLEAFESIGSEMITLKFPVYTIYDGFNNPGDEFENPYESNIAKTTIVANYMPVGSTFNITVGKYVSSPYRRYMISKAKPLRLYNGVTGEETEDRYPVSWTIRTGVPGQSIILKETRDDEEQQHDIFIKNDASEESMEDVATNVGIYFSNAESVLGEQGKIYIYDDETDELIHTFTANEWNDYYSSNPYIYDRPVKHIRLVTSETVSDSYFYVYNVKEINDEKILEKYTREQFDELQYIKSRLVAYIGDNYIGTISHQAYYEEPYSVASISLSDSAISTQVSEKGMKIYVSTIASEYYNEEEWIDGEFLIKIPDEIIDFKINSVTSNSNMGLNIDSYEKIINDDGKFIRIKTSNLYSDSYTLTINVDITPDPRIPSSIRDVTLYASNEYCQNYYYPGKDVYDVDNDGNVDENVNVRKVSLNMVAPNSLLTNQIMSDFDTNGTIVISPQIADLKPIYGDDDREKQTVRIGAQLTNNYSSSVSEVIMLGKIPFEGNTYVLSGNNLGSEFSTTMKDTGIEVPAELEGQVKVYYSTNPNPNKNLLDTSNGWMLYEDVADWTQIKTWLVDFQDTVLDKGQSYTFYYTAELPYDFNYNKTTYSHHGIYFALDTDEGKYLTQTEPTKIGIRIIDNYNVVVNKYQKNLPRLVPGATYRISKLFDDGTIDESQTAITNADGSLEMANLYVEKVYEIKEIQTPDNYELNNDIIKIIGHVNHAGELSIEKLEGTVKGNITVIPSSDEVVANKAVVNVEDEVRANLKLVKTDNGDYNPLGGVRYWIGGPGMSEGGKYYRTNSSGEIDISGLLVGETYTLTEIKAPDEYYINEIPVEFSIENNNGTYEAVVTRGEVRRASVTTENDIPTAKLEIKDDFIPTFELEINKIEQGTGVGDIERVPIVGAVFRIYKDGVELGEYITNDNGKIDISPLRIYDSTRPDYTATYTLKEIIAPEGYVATDDITFTVEYTNNNNDLLFNCDKDIDYSTQSAEGNRVTITLEDLPSFILTKKDGETNTLLPNVKFAIYKSEKGGGPARDSKGNFIGTKEIVNGKEYYVVTTDENGQIKADLPEGIYRVVELEADPKYDIAKNTKYFGIGKGREGVGQMAVDGYTTVAGVSAEYIEDLEGTRDGGYIIGGYSHSSRFHAGNIYADGYGNSDGYVAKYDEDGNAVWLRTIPGSTFDAINAITETVDGKVIAGGYFSNSVEIGGVTYTGSGYQRMIVVYDTQGNVEKVKLLNNTNIESISKTTDGGFLVAGSTSSTGNVTIDGYAFNIDVAGSNTKGLLLKYDSNANIEWAKVFAGPSSVSNFTSVIEANDGNIYAAGYFTNTLTIGEIELTNNGSNDAMLVKYDELGNIIWAKSFGGANSEQLLSVTETDDGGCVVSGIFFSPTMTVVTNELENADVGGATSDGIIVKYTKAGKVSWVQTIGSVKEEKVYDVEATSDGGIIAAVYYKGNLSFGEASFTADNYGDGLLVRYDSNGQFDRGIKIYGNVQEEMQQVSETSEGKYLVGGIMNGSDYMYIGGNRLNNEGSSIDTVIVTIDYTELPTTITEYAIGFDGKDDAEMYDVVATDDGGYLVGGNFYGNQTIEDYTLENDDSSRDALVIKYASDNTVDWVSHIRGSGIIRIYTVDKAADGGYYAAGEVMRYYGYR